MTCGRAGRYLFELEVTDDFAASSTCEVHVDACTCNNDLHVELVWDTPGDPDPNDSGAGANLDLHLLRGDGDWFCRPDDTWALNLSPDWGQLDVRLDNPSLDDDDDDGAGPENIDLSWPEADTAYRVGVHYVDDHGLGPSVASVRIVSRGELLHSANRELTGSDAFWEVATVSWPSGEITPTDALLEARPDAACE